MILTVKQLKQNGQIIVPQTVAEAVLVKSNNSVITLNKALDKKQDKILTPIDSGLKQVLQNGQIILTHSNNITPNEKPQALLIKHDSHGHIIESVPSGNITISIQDNPIIESNKTEDQNLNLGDDFELDITNTIKLKFNNL